MPPVVLEILVDDSKGTPELRIFQKTFADTQKQVEQSTQTNARAAQSTQQLSTSLGSSTKNALAFAGALTGIQGGISAVASVVQGLVSEVGAFEAAMANVNTLGIRSVAVQQQLRAELLQLPSVLGSATDLAKGLYEVLSSGIEPAKAVQFLETSANLARAGLGQLDTATAALTKTMQAFRIPTEEASRVADVLFKTVEVGQGSLEQFAQAFPQVTQIAAGLGLSLTDTANAMATLTQTFRNADTAATGFRSLLAQLIQNSDKFLALGINIKQVISEQGLLGVVRTLQQVSQGSSERLKTFINDIEGFNAAAALTGPQFQTLIKNQALVEQSTGSVARAVQEQTKTATAAWQSFTTSVSKLAQDLAPPLTSLFATLVGGTAKAIEEFRAQMNRVPEIARGVKQDLDKLAPEFAASVRNLLQVPVPDFKLPKSIAEVHAEVQRLADRQKEAAPIASYWTSQFAKADTELNKALIPLTKWRDETERSTAAQQVAAQQLAVTNTAILQLDAALKLLKPGELPKVLSVGEAQQAIEAVTTALRQLATSSQVDARAFATAYANAIKVIEERFGTLDPVLLRTLDDIKALGERTRASAQIASSEVPRITKVVAELNEQGQVTLKTIERIGPVTAKEMGVASTKVPKLTTVLKEVDEQGKITLKTVELYGPVTKEAMDKAANATREQAKAIEAINTSWLQTRGALERAKGAVDSLEGSTQGLSETAIMLGHSLNEAGKEVNAYGNAVATLSDATKKLMEAQIRVNTEFASTEEGIRKQIAETQKLISDITGGTGVYAGTTLKDREALLKRYNDILQKELEILKTILATNAAQTSATGRPTGTGTTTPPGTPTAPVATTTAPVASAPTSSGPLLGVRPTGSLTMGTGPTSVTPGYTTIGTPLAPTNTTTQRNVTVGVQLNAQMLTADRATLQTIVTQLAPAINEAIRRGEIG